ncbi:MAG: autotransporter outer membrane beta-barrel domain-containing protein, partial [Planctomycetota bacterium]
MIGRTGLACALLICLAAEVAADVTPSEAGRRAEEASAVIGKSAAAPKDITAGAGAVACSAVDPAADRHPACGPGAGDCYVPNGTPGCEDVECCETVCAIDPWCCDSAWDSFCVDKANIHCLPPEPTGACCFYESCRDLTETDCGGAGGVFQGLGDCTATTCSGGAATPQRASTDAGTIYLGAIGGQDWGRPLGSADLDGDNYDEVIVAASESWGGVTSRVYIVRGGPDAHRRGLVDLSSAGVDQVILGAAVDDNLGSSIATGDVNTDGIDDLLLCASTANFGARTAAGMAYLIHGSADFFASAVRDLSSTANWDVRIAGPVAGGDMGGAGSFAGLDTHAAAIGKLNNDQYGDVVLGVHLADGAATQAGRVYVVFGQTLVSGATLDLASGGDYDVVIYGDDTYDETGDFVLTGDITGDGLDELIIPNHYFSQSLFDSEGAVHIFRGRQTWSVAYNLGTAPAEITLLGHGKNDGLGESAAVGDFNSDDIMDLAAAAPGGDVGPHTDQQGDGFVYGLLGSGSYQTGAHTIDYATATPDFLLVGGFEEGLGAETAAGDFNGDGYDDLTAAERFAGPDTNGVVEVLFGRDFTGNPVYTAGVSTDLRIVGAPNDRIGFSLSESDVNGDGMDEVFFG